MLYFCKVGDSMKYRCPKCSAILDHSDNKYVCEYCKSTFDDEYFINNKEAEYMIPFKITKSEAIKIYYNHLNLLTPSKLKSKKHIYSIHGIYVPCYLYDLDSTGVVEFDADKTSTWKSDGVKYIKTDVYKVIRGGNMSLKNLTVLNTTQLEDKTFRTIEPYNYDELIPFNSLQTKSYKMYISDKTKDELLESINSKYKEIFISEISNEIKDYNSLNSTDNSINLYNPSRKYVLLPIWLLNINYKNKNYTYIINGQTGLFSGSIPVNYKNIILVWIAVFLIIFIILFLLNLAKVVL